MSTPIAETKPPMTTAIYDSVQEIAAGIGRVEATLATLLRSQQQERDLGLLLADCRDTITEAVGVMHSQTSDVLQRLDGVQQCVVQPRQRRDLPAWQVGVCGGLVGALLVAGVWTLWPRSVYSQLAGAVDVVLMQHYATLPKVMQEQLNAAYGRLGIQGPGARQKGQTR